MSEVTKLDYSYCPHCRTKVNAAGSIDKPATPKPGDINICFYCANINIYDEDLKVRLPTPEEIEEISKDQSVLHIQEKIRQFIY